MIQKSAPSNVMWYESSWISCDAKQRPFQCNVLLEQIRRFDLEPFTATGRYKNSAQYRDFWKVEDIFFQAPKLTKNRSILKFPKVCFSRGGTGKKNKDGYVGYPSRRRVKDKFLKILVHRSNFNYDFIITHRYLKIISRKI